MAKFIVPEKRSYKDIKPKAQLFTKTERIAADVYNYLAVKYHKKISLDELPIERIIEGIRATHGVDRRTVSGWIERFRDEGIIPRPKTEREKIIEAAQHIGIRTIPKILSDYQK